MAFAKGSERVEQLEPTAAQDLFWIANVTSAVGSRPEMAPMRQIEHIPPAQQKAAIVAALRYFNMIGAV